MTMFKHRTPDAVLLTVPYTGTHFTRILLEVAGAMSHPRSKVYVPHAHWLDANVTEDWTKIMQTKVLVTARDPYLSAIRSIKTGQEDPIEFIANAWELCFTGMNEMDYFVFDIGSPSAARRLAHAQDAMNFIGIDDEMLSRIDDYVERWEPANESFNVQKDEYLNTGNLPEGYDWSLLDNAKAWYRALTTHV